MTTLVLIQKKILFFSKPLILDRPAEWFYNFNKKGVVSFLLLSLILLSVVSYLTAVFVTFDLELKTQATEKELAKLNSATALLDARLQAKELSFGQDQREILESMEKVSSIKYLRSDNFVFSSPPGKY